MRFNHACTVSFEVRSNNDGDNLTEQELLDALESALKEFQQGQRDIVENVGRPFDSVEDWK